MNLILISAAAALSLAVPVDDPQPPARPICAPYKEIADHLEHGQWAERPFVQGLLGRSGVIMHLFTNPATGTWTIIQETPVGSCIIGAGVGLQPAPRYEVDKEGGI